MPEVARFELENGGSIFIELDETARVERVATPGRVVRDVQVSFERALGQVRDVAAVALEQFREIAPRPDEVEIKFGVTLDTAVGAVLARTGIQGHLEVTLRWERQTGDPIG